MEAYQESRLCSQPYLIIVALDDILHGTAGVGHEFLNVLKVGLKKIVFFFSYLNLREVLKRGQRFRILKC